MAEPEITVRGADDLARLTRQLKDAGNKELQKELKRSISESLKPLRRKLPESAKRILPTRGGLNERVAASRITVARKNTSRETGLRLVATNAYTLSKMDDPGEVRHPIRQRRAEKARGRKPLWVKQKIKPGWATKPFEELAPEARRNIEDAMQRVIDQIDRA